MKKIAVFGDRHISKRHPAYSESLRMWDYAIDDAIAQEVDIFVCLGDATEVGIELDEVYEIGRRFQKMAAYGWVVEVDGNHGVRLGMRWTGLLGAMVVDDTFAVTALAEDHLVLGFAPYCRRGYPPYPDAGGTLDENYTAAAEFLRDQIQATRAGCRDATFLVFGHWTPAGFRVGPSDYELTGGKEMVVPLEYLAPADAVFVGHIHEAQELGNVVGVGSLFRTTFAERDQIKSYVIVTVDERRVSWERRPLPTRPMKEIRIAGKAALETVRALLGEDSAQDVKLVIETTPDDKTVYAEVFAPLEAALGGQFRWEVARATHVATRAPEIELSTSLRQDFEIWLPLTYPELDTARMAGVLHKVETL